MDKRFFRHKLLFGLFLSIVIILFLGVTAGFAQVNQSPDQGLQAQITPVVPIAFPTPLPEVSSLTSNAQITLSDLGMNVVSLELNSASDFAVDLPNHWVITNDETVTNFNLHYDFQFELEESLTEMGLKEEDWHLYAGVPVVNVYVDDFLAKSFIPEMGEDHWEKISIPFEALRDQRFAYTEHYHTIEVAFLETNSEYCLMVGTLTIHEDSEINLGFIQNPANFYLSDFPQMLVFESIFPETVYIVLPDSYTQLDLNAANLIVSEMGRRSSANVSFVNLPASQATSNVLANHNVIVVGTPQNNSFIKGLYDNAMLSTSLTGSSTINRYVDGGQEAVPETHGILQVIPSEINPSYSYLVVTGQNDEAVNTGARGLVNMLPINFSRNFAVVSPEAVNGQNESDSTADTTDTYTFEDLGKVNDLLFLGKGILYDEVSVFIPFNWDITENATLIVNYEFSNKLSAVNSSITVRVNDQPIGSIPLTGVNDGEKRVSIPLKKEYFIPGRENLIIFEAVLTQQFDCANWDRRSYWINISNSSIVHLPHELISDFDKLPKFTDPFDHLAFGEKVLFVLPKSINQDMLDGLTNLIYRISRLEGPAIKPTFEVITENQFDSQIYKSYHIVALGLPSENQVIAQINDDLYQPFLVEENKLMQSGGDAIYRLSDDVGIGVIEIISSPWDATQSATVISGTSLEGVQWAIGLIGDINAPIDWLGNLFFVREDRVSSYFAEITTLQSLDQLVTQVAGEEVSLELVDQTAVPVQATAAGTQATPTPDQFESSIAKEDLTINTSRVAMIIGLIGLGLFIIILTGIRISRGGHIR